MDQGGGRNIEVAQAKPVRTGGASSSKSLSVSGVTAGIAGMDIDTNTGIGASAGAGGGGQGNNNAIPGNLPNSVTATSAITPPSMPSMRGSPLDQPRSRHPTSPTAPPTPPSASAATSKAKGKFKLDPYSLLLPHERKMYQQSQSSSAPGSGSASPQSNPGSVGPSPTNNALKLGRMAPHGHGQGQGAYTAFEQGHKQVQMQMQPQAHVQQGVAGAHMQAGPGAQRQSHVQGQAQSPQQAQAHFYHGQGHEQWQTSIQGAATGGQQPQGTATRLVSSMGEQGSHGRQAQPTGRLYQPPPPPQAAPLSPPASAFTPSSPAWDVMSTTSTAAYGGQVDVGNTAATREWARHQASGSNAPGNNAGAATTAGAAGRYKFGSGPPSHPAQSLRGSGKARLEDWEIVETLGTGTFGRVLLVRQRPSYRPTAYHPIFPHLFQSLDPLSPSPASTAQADGQLPHFAMKVLRKSEVVRLKQVEHINSERAILERIRHPFVVELYATYQDSLNVYMLLSYIPGGELFSHLRRAGRFSADVTRFYLASIVLAIDYLHAKNIIYRDLKPENLLLDRVGYLRIADFGFAKVVEDRTFTLCGTPEYLAPEIVLSQGHGKAVDWWALGILAFEMLAGYPPFFDDHTLGIYEKILRNEVAFPSHVDPYAKDLIRGLLTADRSKRLGNLKGGARDVMGHPWFAGVDWGSLERKEIGAPIIPRVSNMGDSQNFQRYPPPRPHELPGIFGQTYKSTGDQYAELFTAFTFPEDATRTREQSRTSRAQSVAVEQGQHRGPEQMRQPTESGGDTAME